MRPPLLLALVSAVSVPAIRPGAVRAQAVERAPLPPARGTATGQVVDAVTGEPLGGAVVVLVPRPEGVIPPGASAPSGFVAGARTTRSDAAGRYRFEALASGTYRLRASRLGYGAAAVDITVADAAPEVSLGLLVAPLALHPVTVRAPAPDARVVSHARAGNDDTTALARRSMAAVRQRAYLATDARELARADVLEAATLGESDLFRALHRLPGVSTRDEWAAELWTRGARPDQTRVLFDGLPLFGPVAAFGAFAAVNADVVGGATLLPGVRPADVGEGSAAVLDLRTRAGGRAGGRPTSRIGGVGEVGVVSARLALDGSTADGRRAWSIGGRRSYLAELSRVFGGRPGRLPSFGDLTGRGDVRLSPTQTLAVSGLVQRTASPRSLSWLDLPDTRAAAWGNRLLRVTHAAAVGGVRVTHTAGGTAFHLGAREPLLAEDLGPFGYGRDAAAAVALARRSTADARATAVLLRGVVAPVGATAAVEPVWSAGYEIGRQHTHYAGPARAYFAGGTDMRTYGGGTDASSRGSDTVAVAGRVTVGALWASRRWQPAARLTVEPGLRLELAGSSGLGSTVRPSPRVAARYTLDANTRVSVAVGRSVQYTQALSRAGIMDDAARFGAAALWLAAGRDAPPLVTDLATLGAERWFGAGWLGSVNAYARRTAGLATYDPAPGLAAHRALYVVAREGARGVEISARRLAGRTTGTFAYSWSASTLRTGGWRYAAPQDRSHVLDATLSRRVGGRWRVGGAFSAATGTPYTRTVARLYDVREPVFAIAQPITEFVRAEPNAHRNPAFLGADLLAEWARPVRGWHVAAYAQLHSPLAAVTSDAYRAREACRVPAGSAPEAVFGPGARCARWARSAREATSPVIPTAGVRVAF